MKIEQGINSLSKRGVLLGLCLLMCVGAWAEKGDSLTKKPCTLSTVAAPDSSLLLEPGVVVEDTLVFEDVEEPDQVNTPTDDEAGRNLVFRPKSTNSFAKSELPRWKVYPNPTRGSVHVLIPFFDNQTKAVIRDQNGRLIQKLDGSFTHVNYLSKGIYWIEVERLSQREIKKLIVH
jgi:hypothetical protein